MRGDFIPFSEFYFDDLEEGELSYLNHTKDITIYEKLLYQDAQYRILEKRLRQRIKALLGDKAEDGEQSAIKSISEAEKQLADLLAKHDRVLVQIAKLESEDNNRDDFEITIGGESYEA